MEKVVEVPSIAALAESFRQQFTEPSKEKVDRLTNRMKSVTLQDLDTKKRGLAKGGFGTIDVVQLRDNEYKDKVFALKRMNKSRFYHDVYQRQVLAEKEILRSLDCTFIVKYYTSFHDDRNIYILMEFCPGRDLWRQCPVNQRAATFYTACMIEALFYLHQRNIIHRDIKTENVVLDGKGYVKLVDFGLSHRLTSKNPTSDYVCGTVRYRAPEMVRLIFDEKSPGYDQSVDLWGLGQLVYFLLTGHSAFNSKDRTELLMGILGGMGQNFEWRPNVSGYAKDFILQLCTLNPAKRLGCEQRGGFAALRRHPWLIQIRWGLLRRSSYPPPQIPGPFSLARCLHEEDLGNKSQQVSTSSIMSLPTSDRQWAQHF